MKANLKKILLALVVAGSTLIGYFLWLSLHPVKIIAVHQSNNYSDILVENFPVTDKGKIKWWLKNKTKLKEKYRIPVPSADGFFSITFWNFAAGYKEEEKYDRLCFNDMHTKKNCIEKDAVFTVERSNNTGILFTVYDGTYHLKNNGEIIKLNRE
ncbi:DUF943 family protein [Kosakonia oryziphila]|uniref:Putative membrane protein n=1 Tax=Kosakonia oryziphila TaxID=1005667 RepID=A0A1C4GL99_9ENTR|nr:DUF943 family protein [Kosakonia oryziphila]SCC68916.1 putative membrane protein [Kosakonia oryziphila]